MRLLLWAHGQTFAPAWAEERQWIEAYAQAWRKRGAEVRWSHSLSATAPEADTILHLFGAGHWESWHWLRPLVRELWVSPLPFTNPHAAVAQPPGKARGFLSASARLNRSALLLPDRYICHSLAAPRIAKWGVSPERVSTLDEPSEELR